MSIFHSGASTERSKNTGNPAATLQFSFGSSLGGPSSTLGIATGFGNEVAAVGTTMNASFLLFGNSSAPTTTSVSFGGSTNVVSTSTKPVFSLGVGSTANASLSLSFGTNATMATTSVFPFSLGTALNASTNITTGKTPKQNTAVPVLEIPLPNEVLESVNYLKDFFKQQKSMATEIAFMTSKRSNEVSVDLTMCQKNLELIEHNLDKQKASIEKLKNEMYKCIHDFGIAQRNHDHPELSLNDMESYIKYFTELIKSTQEKANILKNEIETTEQYLAMLPYNNNGTVNELRRLGEVIKKDYENATTLAGLLHGIHKKSRR